MSQRITKDIARSVALQLTETKRTELDQIKKELLDICDQVAESRVPKEILNHYSDPRFKNYIKTTENIRLIGPGLSYQWYDLSRNIPTNGTDTFDLGALKKDEETAKKIVALLNKQSKKREECRKLVSDIENSLSSLRTYNKIKEEFKEAYDLLPIPKTVSKELTVSIDSIRKKLKQ